LAPKAVKLVCEQLRRTSRIARLDLPTAARIIVIGRGWRKLALLVNAESVTEAERLSAEALDAAGEVTSLGGLLSALAAAAAPLPSVPVDVPLLVTQAHDILAEHEESAHTRRVRTAASSTSGGKGGAPHRGSSSSSNNDRAAKRCFWALAHGVSFSAICAADMNRWRERFMLWLMDGGRSLRRK
jgi:hypothetical protein